MFQKVLIAEDMDYINSGIRSELSKLKIAQIDYAQYCDEALLKLKKASIDQQPYDLLISDLSFEDPDNAQKLRSGDALIEVARKTFPNLKIVVFSIEDKAFRIQKLHREYQINAYVWKSRNGLQELKQAIRQLQESNLFYISPQLSGALSKNKAIEISDYDIFLIECISNGYLQEQISAKLKEKAWTPTSVSTIEKRLKILKEHFNANTPAHLVSVTKDLGLI